MKRLPIHPMILAMCACAGGCGGLGHAGRAEIRTSALAVTFQTEGLRWRVEDVSAPAGAALLFDGAIVLETAGGAVRPGGEFTSGPEETLDAAFGPARARTVRFAGGADGPGMDLTIAAAENRRAVSVSAAVRNTGRRPLTMRRIRLSAPDASRLAGPPGGNGTGDVLLLLQPPLSRGPCRIVAAGDGPVHAGSWFSAAWHPTRPWALAAGFAAARHAPGAISWQAGTPPAPALRLGADAEYRACVLPADGTAATDELFLFWESSPAAALAAFADAVQGPKSMVPGPGAAVPGPPSGLPGAVPADPNSRTPEAGPATVGPRTLDVGHGTLDLCGWSSWHAGYRNITEDFVLQNVDFAARHLREAGASLIVVEDGYQRAAGDWETNDRFPRGHRWLTDQIHARGLKAALWLAPFLVAEGTALHRERPEWMVRDAAGLPRPDGELPEWGGRFHVLDATQPAVRAWLADLVRRAVGEWGYDAVKLDYVERALHGDAPRGGDPANAFQACALALDAMRQACGPDRAVYVAGAPTGAAAGIASAARVSPDAAASWAALRAAALPAAARQPLNGRLWRSDADAVLLRAPLTDDEAAAWASLCAIAGWGAVAGDPLPSLAPARAALLQKLLPLVPAAAASRPLDLFDADRRRGPLLVRADPAAPPWPLPGAWRFKPGDQSHWKEILVADADWTPISVPGDWKEGGFPGDDGYAWYRLRFALPAGLAAEDLVLDLGPVDDADATYLNGELIGSTGRFPPEYESRWTAPRRYAVPARLLRTGDGLAAPAENVLAVRVYSQAGPAGIMPAAAPAPPALWHLPYAPGGEKADLLLVINWEEAPRRLGVPVDRLGLDPGSPHVVYDATGGALIEAEAAHVAADVRPHAARMLVVRPAHGRPQVLATSRHLLPGAVDLEGVVWDETARALKGTSRRLITDAGRIPGVDDPAYALILHAPPGWSLVRAAASQPCLAVRAAPELVRIEFPELAADTVEWTVSFTAAGQ